MIRLVVLNNVAKSISDVQRRVSKAGGLPYNGTPVHRINDSAWQKARVRTAKLWQEENLRPAHPGYLSIRVHDLKHTFGRRLRAAGVTEEHRKALLGLKNGSITGHYSGAELGHLIEAANMVSATDSRGPVLTILKRRQA
jgi:integrase